jgi:putative membrane protein
MIDKPGSPAFGPNHFALSEADRARIAEAVTAAEAHSAGEIVTILADQSDGYEDIALIWSALVALLALAVLSSAPQFYLALIDRILGAWDMPWLPGALFTLAAIVVTIKFAATWLILRWRRLRFALVPGPIKHARVRARALSYYRVGAEKRTTGGTGVLIYLSRAERRAEIVTDPEVTNAIPAQEWGAAMAAMLGHIGDNRVADGMVEAIGKVGAVLTRHFPRAAHDTNQLPDRVIEV